MDKEIQAKYNLWLNTIKANKELAKELDKMRVFPEQIEDAFYKDLEFGTGGLRGIIGAGTNKMNVYTVGKASQGLSNYINNNFPDDKRSVAIAYDSRIHSELFAKTTAEVFSENGIQVYIFKELMPTPILSFVTRELHCSAGVCITASHNPSNYNGYKVYGSDGCQITTKIADEIYNEIKDIDIFADVKRSVFDSSLKNGMIEYIKEETITSYINSVKKLSVIDNNIDKSIKIVYTPLNGAGLKPVLRTLNECGFSNIIVVDEQAQPNGNFPTCKKPNPEEKDAMTFGIDYCKKYNADLLIATDPDCDRCGIAAKNKKGDYELLTGNLVGCLLLDFICSVKTLPKNPKFIKTIVTTNLAERIANSYNMQTINVLTGFKYIGEQISLLENNGMEDSFVFSFEESYGYLSGTHVRDKDGVNAALLISEMFAYYKSKNISIFDRIIELYNTFGFVYNYLESITFKGQSGMKLMSEIMNKLRSFDGLIFDKKIIDKIDYLNGSKNLPPSNVIQFILDGDCSVVFRPSGTEPKLKIYFFWDNDKIIDSKSLKEFLNKL